MFPCDTPKHFSLGRTKVLHFFFDGLVLFLVKKLMHAINTIEFCYTLIFDVITMAQLVKQMTLLIHHCETRDEVRMEYLGSLFFGRATAGDLLEMIFKEIEDSGLSTEKLFDLWSWGGAISIWPLLLGQNCTMQARGLPKKIWIYIFTKVYFFGT